VEKEDTAPEFDPFAEETPKPQRAGRGVRIFAALALLIALAVAGWNGWQWWQGQQGDDARAQIDRALAEVQSRQEALNRSQQEQAQRLASVERLELEQGLAQLDEALDQARSIAGSDRARLQGLEADLEDLIVRLDALEGRVGALVMRGESPRQALDLAEVDYLLRSATERLALYGDVRTADQALRLADQQLEALDDPVYLSVRRSIAAARLSLEAVDSPDRIALTEGLGRLQAEVAGLPFPGEVSVRDAEGHADTVEDPGVWARFTAALSGLVTVRRRSDEEALVSLQDKDAVRQGLWLQLESARLALLRDDDAAYTQALQRAQGTVTQYFDAEAAEVGRFQAGLERLSEVTLAVAWPDISEPWTRLQSIRATPGTPEIPEIPETLEIQEMPETRAAPGSESASPGDADGPAEDMEIAEPEPAAPAEQPAEDDGSPDP
jgi:uroporphyrin-3 C-methyltransferase